MKIAIVFGLFTSVILFQYALAATKPLTLQDVESPLESSLDQNKPGFSVGFEKLVRLPRTHGKYKGGCSSCGGGGYNSGGGYPNGGGGYGGGGVNWSQSSSSSSSSSGSSSGGYPGGGGTCSVCG